MLYDKVGNCMNENEMNMQNGLNNQPISPNTGVPPVQPMTNNMGTSMGIPNNGGVSQPINTGVVANSIPQPVNVAPEGTRNSNVEMPVPNNFMEDFSQAVVPESVIPTPNVSLVQPETVIATPIVESTENVSIQNSSPVVETSTPSEVSMTPELQQQAIPIENTSRIQNVEEEKPKKKKKGNWAFIIALFAVVGFFVLLLPLLVRIFGY